MWCQVMREKRRVGALGTGCEEDTWHWQHHAGSWRSEGCEAGVP